MELAGSSVLKMHQLGRRKENSEEILIGRTDVSDFVVLPNIAIDLIDYFDKGLTIEQVEAIMKEKEIDVDVMDFAQALVNDLEFVHTVDGKVVNEEVIDNGHFHWITQKQASIFFNKYMSAVYALFLLAGIVLCIGNPAFIPNFKDAFVFPSVTLSIITTTVIGWFLLFLHEFGHLLAAKSLGIKSRIGLGHRLVFPVAETDMSNIVLLPHKQRYRALLAGMAWDGTLFGIGVILLFINQFFIAMDPNVIAIIRMINLASILGIAFQFLFYIETDMYYVFTTFFKCNNLIHNTRLYIWSFVRKVSDEQREELENIDPKEKKVMKRYIGFYIVGVIWALSIFFAVTLPTLLRFISLTFVKMVNHPLMSMEFFDGIIFIVLSCIPFGVLVWSWIRTWRTRRRERENSRLASEMTG